MTPLTLATVWHCFQSICKEMRHVIDRPSQNYLIAHLHELAFGGTSCAPRGSQAPALHQNHWEAEG